MCQILGADKGKKGEGENQKKWGEKNLDGSNAPIWNIARWGGYPLTQDRAGDNRTTNQGYRFILYV